MHELSLDILDNAKLQYRCCCLIRIRNRFVSNTIVDYSGIILVIIPQKLQNIALELINIIQNLNCPLTPDHHAQALIDVIEHCDHRNMPLIKTFVLR